MPASLSPLFMLFLKHSFTFSSQCQHQQLWGKHRNASEQTASFNLSGLKRTLGRNHWAEEASNLSKASGLKLGCGVDKTFQLRKNFFFLFLGGGGEDLSQGWWFYVLIQKCLIPLAFFGFQRFFGFQSLSPVSSSPGRTICHAGRAGGERRSRGSHCRQPCLPPCSFAGGHRGPASGAPVWFVSGGQVRVRAKKN